MKENKYKKTFITNEAEYILTECKTGILLTKVIAEGIESELFCEGITFDDIGEYQDLEKYEWAVLTEEEKAALEPWEKVKRQAPTVPEPFCMSTIRSLHKQLIKWELYAFDYNIWRIDQFNSDSHSLKAQRYDKDLIHAGTSDSTAMRAEKSLTNPYQVERRRVAQAILETRNFLVITDPKKAEFMEAAYACDEYGKKKYIEKDLAEMFNIADRTVLNWKNSIISSVAYNLGLEIEESGN